LIQRITLQVLFILKRSPIFDTLYNLYFDLTLLITLVVSLVHQGHKELQPIRIWLIYVLADELLDWVVKLSSHSAFLSYRPIHTNLESLINLSLLYIFFARVITRPFFRVSMLVMYISYLVACSIMWMPLHHFKEFSGSLIGFNYFCIAIPCVFYFYDLLRSELETDLKKDPVFYVVCGIFCFYAVAFPFGITYKILYDATPGVMVFLVTTSAVFDLIMKIFIIKAFLCPVPRLKYS
jgi:hypothetical protein